MKRLLFTAAFSMHILSGYADNLTIPPAYISVATFTNVPADILYTIARTESLYSYRPDQHRAAIQQPWPWTLNIDQQPHRFNTKAEAVNALINAVNEGSSVDIGLMQINWRWHKQRFHQPEAALDPIRNLTVGADILREQFQKSEDWWSAVGAYHAPGRDQASKNRAQRYQTRVQHHWQRLVTSQRFVLSWRTP